MHKLLAIFLAIGIVNADIFPDTCHSLCNNSSDSKFVDYLKANGYDLTEVIAKLEKSVSSTSSLNFWSELQETTVTVPIDDVQALLNALIKEYNGVCSLATLLVRVGVLFELDVAYSAPSELYSIEVDLQLLSNVLSTVNGNCSIQTILAALINVVEGLLKIIASVPSSLLSIVVALLRTDNQADCAELVVELNILLQAKVNTLGPIIIAIAKVFKIKIEKVPSCLANIAVDVSALIALLVGKTGLIGINVVLAVLVTVVGSLLTLVTVVSGTLLSILAGLLSTKNQVNVADLVAVLQTCLDNGVNTLGPLLAEICNLFGLSVVIPSLFTNLVVDISAIIALLAGTTGLIDIKVVLALLGTAVVGLLDLVVSVPGTLLSIISILLSSGKECLVVDLLVALSELLEDGVNTLGPVLVAIAKCVKVELDEDDIPGGIRNLAVNLSLFIACLAERTGSIGVNGILILIATCVSGVLNLVVSVKSGLLVIVKLLSSVAGLLSVDKLQAVLSSLKANASLEVIIERVADEFGVDGLNGVVPKAFAKTTGVLTPLLALLTGCSGSITVSYFISLIGCVVPALLTVSLRQLVVDLAGTILQKSCRLCTITSIGGLLVFRG